MHRHWDEERGRFVVEEVHVHMDLDPYLDLRALADYSGLSVRTLRGWLHHHDLPLPHHDVGGKVLVKRSEFDRWMHQFRDQRADPPPRSVPMRAL